MDRRPVGALGVHAIVVLAACHAGPAPDGGPEELRALLDDAPLVHVPSITSGAVPAKQIDPLAQPPTFFPLGQWTFNDCEADRADLLNGSLANTAYRSVGVACAPGVIGRGVAISTDEDIVYVPDQPYFTFEAGVTVAGWFQPTDVDRTQTLFRKRDRGTSVFALALHRGRFKFVIDLGDGRAASVAAPAPARPGVFQHVAATYDGAALRLYIDGQQVAVREVAGTIAPGPGPLVMGNDGSRRRFDGVIDEAVFDLRALTPDQILQLTCVPAEPLVVATPAVSAPTPPDVAASFDVAITNRNPAACVPMTFFLQAFTSSVNLSIEPVLGSQSPPMAGGETTHLAFTATPFDSVTPGPIPVNFEVLSFDWGFGTSGTVDVTVSEPPGCHVSKSRELLITAPSVVADPIRAVPGGPAGDSRAGAWSFKHLMEEMATTPGDAPAMVEDMLRTFTAPQVINGFTAAPRRGMIDVLDHWPRTPDGKLDLDQAPIRLQAIVNRIDLRDLSRGNAGLGSFVFTFTSPDGLPLQVELLLEYTLPAATEGDVLAWAQAFHALGALPFSEPYNVALQAITDRFVRRGARPDGVNGSALRALRSNDLVLDPAGAAQLRAFALSPATGRLVPIPLDGTPDQSFNADPILDQFLTANRDAVLAGALSVPAQLEGRPFQAGAVFNRPDADWTANVDPEVRRDFALGTCNGCHSIDETGTALFQVSLFGDGQADLSPFLRGGTIRDPFSPALRTFNDLLRRVHDLESIVCADEPRRDTAVKPRASLRRGISRVH